YADGSSYQITYEDTPGFAGSKTGRIASVTLPTGGTISYGYSGGSNGRGIFCDGTTAGFTRQTPDGTWTYARGGNPLTDTITTTTVADPSPAQNQTVYTFSGIHLTEKQVYQGSSSSGTLLGQEINCYNNNWTNCPAAAVTGPISLKAVFTTLGGHWKQ